MASRVPVPNLSRPTRSEVMRYSGVAALASDLLKLKQEWELDSVAATRSLPDGHRVTLKWVGQLLTIENDDGVVVTAKPDELGVSCDR
jgi:hypothetical protein